MIVLTRTQDSPVLSPETNSPGRPDPVRETGKDAVSPHDPRVLHALARGIRGTGWLVAFVILVVGTVMAARAGADVAILLRVTVAAAVVAVSSAAAWLINLYANGKGTR